MISLLGSLLGFGSSLIGPVLETWNKNSDQKYELAMLHAQAEVQSRIQDQKLEATIVEADTAEIVALMEAEGITDMTAQEYVERAQARAAMHRNRKAAGVSVADSLAYSVDGESTIADNSMYGQYNQRYGYGAAVGGRYSPNMQSG